MVDRCPSRRYPSTDSLGPLTANRRITYSLRKNRHGKTRDFQCFHWRWLTAGPIMNRNLATIAIFHRCPRVRLIDARTTAFFLRHGSERIGIDRAHQYLPLSPGDGAPLSSVRKLLRVRRVQHFPTDERSLHSEQVCAVGEAAAPPADVSDLHPHHASLARGMSRRRGTLSEDTSDRQHREETSLKPSHTIRLHRSFHSLSERRYAYELRGSQR